MNKEKLYTKYNFNLKQLGIIKKLYNINQDKVEEYFDNLSYEEMKGRVNLISKIAEGNNEFAKIFDNTTGI